MEAQLWPIEARKQGTCNLCKKKILRRKLIRKLAIGWVHEDCYQKVKPPNGF